MNFETPVDQFIVLKLQNFLLNVFIYYYETQGEENIEKELVTSCTSTLKHVVFILSDFVVITYIYFRLTFNKMYCTCIKFLSSLC